MTTDAQQFDNLATANNTENAFKTPQPRKVSQRPTVTKDKITFYNELIQFHDKIGTPITRFPRVNGKEIDLHKLYNCMVARGGWMKVNIRDEWDEVLTDMELSDSCVNISIAIKQIYIRYLDRYEKVNFLGENIDRCDDEDDESEKMHVKRLSSRTLHSIPQTYNHNQHYLSESLRMHHKLPVNGRRQSEYDKLLLSLMSPLPNEQDFAINVCTLMSNEGRHVLKLEKCPRLLDTLLAHAGIFDSTNTREIFTEFYSNIRKHSLESFWKDCLAEKPHFLELSYQDFFNLVEKDDEFQNEIQVAKDTLMMSVAEQESTGNNIPGLESLKKKILCKSENEMNFLSLSRGLGTHDYIGQRIHQIATISRNLSFIEENIKTLAKNRSFLRFLVMMANVRWNNLHHMGLDMLGNVALEIELQDPIIDHLTRSLMTTVTDGLIEGEDRGVIISCLEILSKLSQKESNEELIHKCLTQEIYNQICVFLCLNDIMLLLYTLECIYSLSSLGEKACNHLMHVRGITDTLVSLVTVEAQSYGPDACILMRVVETIPSNMLSQHQQQSLQHQKSQAVTQQLNIQNEPISSIPATITVQTASEAPPVPFQGNVPPQSLTTTQPNAIQNQILENIQTALLRPPTIPENSIDNVVVNSNTNTKQTSIDNIQKEENTNSCQKPTGLINTQNLNSVSAKHAQQQLIQENEQFAYAWLRATIEPASSGSRIEQNHLYQLYIQASQKIGRKGVLSPLHFPRCVRTVFGGTIGPNQCKTIDQNRTESLQNFYEGLTFKQNPLPVVHKTIHTPSTSPLLQQVLQNTNQSEKNIIVVQQSASASNAENVSVAQSSQASTSMHIRSLLANKVTPNNKILISGQPSDQVVVTCNQVVASQNNINTINNNNNRNNIITTIASNNNQNNISHNSGKIVTNITSNATSNCLISPSNVNQVTQRQLQKQKDNLVIQSTTINNTSIVVNANNPNNPTNIKLGNSTISIKPGTLPNNTVITATNPNEQQQKIVKKQLTTNNNPPPLAPLSQTVIKPLTIQNVTDVGNALKKGEKFIKIDSTDINSNNGNSLKSSANKMLADLLEKKSDPPSFEVGVISSGKRKIDGTIDPNENQPSAKRQENGEIIPGDLLIKTNGEEKTCKKAADLYAELAGSILEDEDDMEELTNPQMKPSDQKLIVTIPGKQQNTNTGKVIVPVPIQRQLIVQNQPQLTQGNQQTATVKTDSGYQTVPIILQQSMTQKQVGTSTAPNQTQYILATNQQGQTVMVPTQTTTTTPHHTVHQPANHQQTVLLAQTPQQHGSATKTIIILQQPGGQVSAISTNPTLNQTTPQKVIMTTPQGQQLLVTQMPRPGQQIASNNIISTAQTQSGQKIFITRNSAGEIELQKHATVANVGGQQVLLAPSKDQTATGQIILQQSPGGSQQLVNLVQTTQTGQIVVQAKPNSIVNQQPRQILATKNKSIPNPNHVVLQKQGIQLQTPTNAQMQVQTKTVIVTPQNISGVDDTRTASENIETKSETESGKFENTLVNGDIPIKQGNNNNDQTESNESVSENESTSKDVLKTAVSNNTQPLIQMIPAMDPSKIVEEDVDPNWPWVCDWRGCPRKKFKSANEVYLHACAVHCPDNVEPNADIYCQWGPGPGLCDNLPRKRFSLMTHIFDRHCMQDSFQAAVKRRTENAFSSMPKQPYPVTLIRQPQPACTSAQTPKGNEQNNSVNNGPLQNAGSAALQAIKRHTVDFPAAKEMTNDNEGPVTKSIRLTSALILRNLVNYSTLAKRNLRHYESHLASVALSNVESSRTIAQVLYDMNETHPV